jgi:CheY-like chemotaxis protein
MNDKAESPEEAGQATGAAGQSVAHAGRPQDRLLALLAHELRNPLTAIRNVVTILQLQASADPTTVRAVAQLDRQSSHLIRLLDQLQDLSQWLRGRLALHKEIMEVGRAVGLVESTVRPAFAAQNVRLEMSLPPGPLNVEADPARLQQIVAGLLLHSLRHTPSGGCVHLFVQTEPGMLVLQTQDNGFGIAPEVLPNFFDLSAPDDSLGGHRPGAAGIGLLFARALAELHGGTLGATSAGPSQGTTLTVRLPQQAALVPPGDDVQRTPPGPARGRPARVLYVDDDPDIAESLAQLLRDMGHETRVAHGGPEALALARDFRPEVVLLDLGLPGMDGFEVARRLREQPGQERLPLIAVSGYGHEEDQRRSREAGIEHHLVKPVRAADLVRVLAGIQR